MPVVSVLLILLFSTLEECSEAGRRAPEQFLTVLSATKDTSSYQKGHVVNSKE